MNDDGKAGREKALRWIAERSAAICNHPDVFSCTWIAKGIGEPVHKTRRWMKELEAEGYVVKDHEGGYDDWTGNIYCIHGYSLTRKGAGTEYYRAKYEADAEWWSRSFREGAEHDRGIYEQGA